MQYFQRNLLICLVLRSWAIGRERNMSRLLTFNPGSITLDDPTVKSFVSTEEWTETELLNSQLDCPIGKYWIIWIETVERGSDLHRTYILIRPDSSAWEWLSRPPLSGEVGTFN